VSRFSCPRAFYSVLFKALVLMLAVAAHAQTCLSAADVEPAIRAGLEAAATRYFDMSARGDAASLKQNSIPSLAANFAPIEKALKDNQPDLSGATATVRPPYLLTAEGAQSMAHAEFLCGIFGPSGQTGNSAVFVFNDLPPGKYAIALLNVSGGKKPITLTFVLEQLGNDWKLAGFHARSQEACGHDGAWFAQKARDFKSKSQAHNAWLYYRQAIALTAPVDFMSTQATDKLYDEIQTVVPSDMPVNDAIDLSAGGKTFRWTAIFPLPVGDDLDVVVKYSSADISNTQKTYEDNIQVIRALVTKFPELKSAFTGVVARAVAPSGEDYGTLLPTKDMK